MRPLGATSQGLRPSGPQGKRGRDSGTSSVEWERVGLEMGGEVGAGREGELGLPREWREKGEGAWGWVKWVKWRGRWGC